jgi:hypothetical protein
VQQHENRRLTDMTTISLGPLKTMLCEYLANVPYLLTLEENMPLPWNWPDDTDDGLDDDDDKAAPPPIEADALFDDCYDDDDDGLERGWARIANETQDELYCYDPSNRESLPGPVKLVIACVLFGFALAFIVLAAHALGFLRLPDM